MKKLILFVSFSFLCFTIYAQDFAVINDKDGYINVRKSKDKDAPIVGQLTTASIFSITEEATSRSEWVKIYMQKDKNNGLSGYIYHNRFKPFLLFGRLLMIKKDDNGCSAKNDSILIKLTRSHFLPKQHKLTYDENQDIEKIDGKNFWGKDGEIPKYAINQPRMLIKSKSVAIPASAYNDLYAKLLIFKNISCA